MAYAAYLRIYEPVSAFHEPHRSRWVAYVASSTRPRRRVARGLAALRHLPAGSGDAARGECELAMAMYMRARDRWRAFAEFEQAN